MERLGQNYCCQCKKAVGFTGQSAAYSSLLVDGWLCERHNKEESEVLKARYEQEDRGQHTA